MRVLEQARLLTSLVKGHILKQNIPLTVSLAVTSRCNYRCIYCYGAYYNRKESDFPLNVWLGFIDEVADMGTRLIHLGGGEPLLRDDIEEIINKVKDRGIICRMNTNGALIPKKIDSLKRLDSICVSLDGKAQANDKNRGAGTFEEIVAGIKCAKEHGIPVHVSSVITTNSIGALEEVLELSKEIGFMVEFGLPYEQTTTNKDIPAVKLQDEQVRAFLRKLLRYIDEGYPIFYSTSTYRYALSWPTSYQEKILYDDAPPDFKVIDCYMGKYMCFVDGDGLVYPCGQLIGSFPALNFTEVGFKKAWENLEKNKTCKTCYCPCFIEFNQVYGLKPNVLINNTAREMKNYFFSGDIPTIIQAFKYFYNKNMQ
ncbi:MAG TPA: radical SAM/SPASM domain-containing protein [Candidatus Avalokitesvara rifleensis]|uniref:radical SAM/SPASM domain-containing protein n=1 Tax=Candidatus Avalokitesvara rifleensis TaxID=3367620 RepID=UPI002713EB7A|nr:radical SAM protein [Candidatus Brocadiales bacterium]